jgi:zinc transport system ATP-binding protein
MVEVCIQLNEIVAGYPGHVVLDQAHMTVSQGECVGLVGPNGIGKTTLFKVILGLLRPVSGTVEVLGLPLTSAKRITTARRRLGYVPQQSSAGLLPISVYDSVLIGRWGSSFKGRRRPSREDRQAVEKALDTVALSAYKDLDWRELSGGLQQRTALARAVVREPDLILMDEPTTFLDPEAQRGILDQKHRKNSHSPFLQEQGSNRHDSNVA